MSKDDDHHTVTGPTVGLWGPTVTLASSNTANFFPSLGPSRAAQDAGERYRCLGSFAGVSRQWCSHRWKDVRYVDQFMFNTPVSPCEMERGQEYVCINCGALCCPL